MRPGNLPAYGEVCRHDAFTPPLVLAVDDLSHITPFVGQVQQVQQYYGTIGSQTLGILVDERVLQKIADERGIAVSDEEVDNEIRRRIAAEQGASIEIDVTATAEGRVNATATAAQFTPTPEATIDASATVTATETVTDTEIIEETGPTPTPAPTATPNILSDDDFESNYQTLLNTMRSEAGISEADYREIVRMDLLRTKVQADVEQSAELPEGEEQVHVRHLLTETEEEAQAALDRINAGEAFEAVAAEVSTDPSAAQNAGDLGWISREGVVAEFADAAFALTEPGQLSEPVQSQFGWHVIELLEGPEERPLTPERETQLRTQAWNDLLQEERTLSNTLYEWDVQDVPRDKYLSEFQRPLPTAVPAPTIAVDATVPVTVVPDGADDETPADGGEDASESGSE